MRGSEHYDATVYGEGYDAYFDGMNPNDCPYGDDTEYASIWQEGWSRAKYESR